MSVTATVNIIHIHSLNLLVPAYEDWKILNYPRK
jgi:hypothetical protein